MDVPAYRSKMKFNSNFVIKNQIKLENKYVEKFAGNGLKNK